MTLLSAIFGGKPTDLNIRKSILAYCYGSLPESALSNTEEFLSCFMEAPEKALKARLYAAAKLRMSIDIKPEKIRDVDAHLSTINKPTGMLLFDFSKYGGIFEIETGNRAICPSYVALCFDTREVKNAKLFYMEPTVASGDAMLIHVLADSSRQNLGKLGSQSREKFIQEVVKLTFSKEQVQRVKINVIGPDGYETAHLEIGKDISDQDFERTLDRETKELFGIKTYTDGMPKTGIVSKSVWLKAKNEFDELDIASSEFMKRIEDKLK